ncbi:unnamed protein product [Protopolystoma xenopodis]|uniref:Uncharacterized protein n=1 Tax=Protopolystoma xenopodis TaxID=117903 RepID=A0A3S4ZY90_9PLAT|nr:unnamed protein product [Protopolystoma xenopodis]
MLQVYNFSMLRRRLNTPGLPVTGAGCFLIPGPTGKSIKSARLAKYRKPSGTRIRKRKEVDVRKYSPSALMVDEIIHISDPSQTVADASAPESASKQVGVSFNLL